MGESRGPGWVTLPRRRPTDVRILVDPMDFDSRELVTLRELGLYGWENGFRIERAGVTKAHNGLVCRVR